MKIRLLTLSAVFLLCAFACNAQSIFSIQYRFTNIQDTTLYNVFLVRYDDGKGFYRVNFFDTYSNDYMVIDLDMEETVYKDRMECTMKIKYFSKGLTLK